MLPFLTAADPPGAGEGSLDPLGLEQIAESLATALVPAVRERMLRVRFLTAMAVGAFVREGLESRPEDRDATTYLAWEWHLVEAIARSPDAKGGTQGVPGIGVTRRALGRHGRLDATSYLAAPRVFGFHGVYKRLAVQVGITDVHLGPGPLAERLVRAWSRDRVKSGLSAAEPLIARWQAALRRALAQSPAHTRPGWNRETWDELAHAFLPGTAGTEERRLLRDLLTARDDRRLGALPELWDLQAEFRDADFAEERLHDRLERVDPARGPLLAAIRGYEAFARGLQDGFDILRHVAGRDDATFFHVPAIAARKDFREAVRDLDRRHARAAAALAALPDDLVALSPVFAARFGPFAEPLDPDAAAVALVDLHRDVQRRKSRAGKRLWFDTRDDAHIHVRHAYRLDAFEPQPGRYLHGYRGRPIRRFREDLRG